MRTFPFDSDSVDSIYAHPDLDMTIYWLHRSRIACVHIDSPHYSQESVVGIFEIVNQISDYWPDDRPYLVLQIFEHVNLAHLPPFLAEAMQESDRLFPQRLHGRLASVVLSGRHTQTITTMVLRIVQTADRALQIRRPHRIFSSLDDAMEWLTAIMEPLPLERPSADAQG